MPHHNRYQGHQPKKGDDQPIKNVRHFVAKMAVPQGWQREIKRDGSGRLQQVTMHRR